MRLPEYEASAYERANADSIWRREQIGVLMMSNLLSVIGRRCVENGCTFNSHGNARELLIK